MVRAIIEQIKKLSFCTRRYTNIPAIQLAKKLTALTKGKLTRALCAPGGSLAVGMAIKLARVATGRHKMNSMWDSFHGASLDAISIQPPGQNTFSKQKRLPGVGKKDPLKMWS